MKKLLSIVSLCFFMSAFAQEVPEPTQSDPNYLQRTYGTKSVRYFRDLVGMTSTSEYLDQFSKVSMFKDGKFIDTLRLDSEMYQSGSGYELLYNIHPAFYKSFSGLTCGTAECTRNIKQFLFMLRDEWVLQRYADIKRRGDTLLLKIGMARETWHNYLVMGKNGLPASGKLFMISTGGDTTQHTESAYQYEANQLVKKTTARYSRYYEGPPRQWQHQEKNFDTKGRLTSSITTDWEYPGTKDQKVFKKENIYVYDNQGNLQEQQYKVNDKLTFTYLLSYEKTQSASH